jgi:1-acyl-sn-glycerol-3-phosphate acyltransferase
VLWVKLHNAVVDPGVFVHNSSGSPVPQLTPGPPLRMLGEAIRHLKSLPRDAAQRADAFEALARQIESQSGGAWRADRGTGTDGSIIFLGRQGDALVVAPDGRIFRGAVGRGIDITPNGLRPDHNTLKPLD